MTNDKHDAARKWAIFRFSVVGPLLASPPRRGELHAALEQLAAKSWVHPTTGESASFGTSTVERWYYAAKNEPRDPVNVLRRKVRSDAGEHPSMGVKLCSALQAQHGEHPYWSKQLHYDNLVTLTEQDASLGAAPSYSTVNRYMQAHDLGRKRPPSKLTTKGGERAAQRLEHREVRSYEVSHVGGLWHLDFHEGSREVLEPDGQRYKPRLYGMLDDRSRLGAHAQWYLDETAEALFHGTSQGFMKYGLSRSLMTDGGAAMKAEETRNGLAELGVIHEMTLPLSPYQNGKQESFWGQVEGRLLAMLDGIEELTLKLLNEATQAWLHLDYNRRVHSETGATPIQRFLDGPSVIRPCPNEETLRRAFQLRVKRTQRRSDGTVSIAGVRYEIPSRFRQQKELMVRYARWDLSRVVLVDPLTDVTVARIYPLDKERNADGRRRALKPIDSTEPAKRSGKVAPLLAELMKTYTATGLPPAYLPRPGSLPDTPEDDS